MQLRIQLYKMRKARRTGSLTCSSCGRRHLSALWEGGVCEHCYVPGKIEPVSFPCRASFDPPEQSEETLRLRAECEKLMEEHGLRKFTFVQAIELKKGSFDNWWHGRLGEVGQRRMNRRIRKGLYHAFKAPMLKEDLKTPSNPAAHMLGHDDKDDKQENLFDDLFEEESIEEEVATGSIWL